jgi:Mrp family chromosome partitioning ATPase
MKNMSRADEAAASQNAQFQMLRTLVEREVRRSGVIMVTSAEAGDGKSLTAHGLAHCLAQSGRRTALVDTTRRSRQLPAMPYADDGGDKPVMLTLPPRPRIRGTVRRVRSRAIRLHDHRFGAAVDR